MMHHYEVRFERKGSWIVYDSETGEIATVDDTPCVNLNVIDALGVAGTSGSAKVMIEFEGVGA